MPPYPYFRALYAIPVRQVRDLLTASFRFRLTADTLAVRLCASSLPTRTRDFHPLEYAHAGQTKQAEIHLLDFCLYLSHSSGIPQCVNRLLSRCLSGRIPAEYGTYDHGEACGHSCCLPVHLKAHGVSYNHFYNLQDPQR